MLSKDSDVGNDQGHPVPCNLANHKHQGVLPQSNCDQQQTILEDMPLETLGSISPNSDNLDPSNLSDENVENDTQYEVCHCCTSHNHTHVDQQCRHNGVLNLFNTNLFDPNNPPSHAMNIQGDSVIEAECISHVNPPQFSVLTNVEGSFAAEKPVEPAEASVDNSKSQNNPSADVHLITQCLSRDCMVMIERLNVDSNVTSTASHSEVEELKHEQLQSQNTLTYSVAAVSEMVTPTHLCKVIEPPCVRSAKSTIILKHFERPIVVSPKTAIVSLTACNVRSGNSSVMSESDHLINEGTQHLHQPKTKKSVIYENAESREFSKVENSCSTEESIKLLRRSSHGMKAKLRDAIEIVRDKAAPVAGTKKNPSSGFTDMMAPTKELRVLLKPLKVDTLVGSSTNHPVETDEIPRSSELSDSDECVSDFESCSTGDDDDGSFDPNYVPTECLTGFTCDFGKEVIGKAASSVNGQRSLVPKVRGQRLSKSSFCTRSGRAPQIKICTPVLMPRLPTAPLTFPRPIVCSQNISPSDGSAEKFHTLCSKDNRPLRIISAGSSAVPKTQSTNSTDSLAEGQNNVETVSSSAPTCPDTASFGDSFLPAFECSDKGDGFLANLPSISQMSLTDISLPTAYPSINCNLDQLLPSEPDCLLYLGGLPSAKSPSAFSPVKSRCAPLSNGITKGCGAPLSLTNQYKLVQLDGSPESSSAESEVEIDFVNAHHSVSQISSAVNQQIPFHQRATDPALAEALREASDGDKEMIAAQLLDEMLNQVICDADHKTCKFSLTCRRGIYTYMSKAEKEKVYELFPVAKGFELHCQPDDETEIVRDLLYDMTNRVICQVEHTAEKTGIRKCRPGETCVLFKKYHRSKRPPTPMLALKKHQNRRSSISKKASTEKQSRKKGKSSHPKDLSRVKTGKNTKASKTKRMTMGISNRELDSLLGDSLLTTSSRRTTRSARPSAASKKTRVIETFSQSTDECSDTSHSSSWTPSKAQKLKVLESKEKEEGWSELDDEAEDFLWYDNDDDDDVDDLLASLKSVASPAPHDVLPSTPRIRQTRNSMMGRHSQPTEDTPIAGQPHNGGGFSGPYTVDTTYNAHYPVDPFYTYPQQYPDLSSGSFDSSGGAYYQQFTGQPYSHESFNNSVHSQPPYQGPAHFTDRPSCAYNSMPHTAPQPTVCTRGAALQSCAQSPQYPSYQDIGSSGQREEVATRRRGLRSSRQSKSISSSQSSSSVVVNPKSHAGSTGSYRAVSPAGSVSQELITSSLTLEEAELQSIEADRELITASLLEEMLNKAVCSANHKMCQFSTGCRRGFYIYLDEEDKQKYYEENPVAKGFELHCQPDDQTEIVRDLLYDMTNRVICQVEHTADKTGIRKCRPGETCVLFKKYHRSKRPPTPVLDAKLNFEKSKAKFSSRNVKKAGKAKSSFRGKRRQVSRSSLEQSPRQSVRPARQPRRVSNGNWSDHGNSNIKSSPHDSAADEPGTQSRIVASATTLSTTGGRTKRAVATDSSTEAKTDSQGVTVLPDLSVDVVLPDTSTDDCSTEADSAGEITSRRKNLRKKKKRALTKEERDKQREQMIIQRRTTLKYMGTPRSLVLAQLVQEEAQKQCAEILLPKNLPVYVPDRPPVRSFLFPLELKLRQQDIADIVNDVMPVERAPPGFDSQTIIREMCEVQQSGVVSDSQLLYQLCMFISTSTTDPFSLHHLIQVVAKYSHEQVKRCPLPACNSQLYDKWTQVGTHLLLHLPPVYLQLMSQAFRCPRCWAGFPTPYHHMDHHELDHTGEVYSPPILTGFHSSQLNSFWSSPQFTQMLFIDWPASMGAAKREAVEDYSRFRREEPPPVIPPPTYKGCDAVPLEACQYVSDPCASASSYDLLQSSSPPADSLQSSAPPADSLQSSAQPADSLQSSAPPADSLQSSAPPADSLQSSAPPADLLQSSAPPADSLQSSAPPADSLQSSAPPADSPKSSAPPADSLQSSVPPADSLQSSVPPADSLQSSAPPADSPKSSATSADSPKSSATSADSPKSSAPTAVGEEGQGEEPTSTDGAESLYTKDLIVGVHVDAEVEQTLVCSSEELTLPAGEANTEDVNETMMEYAADKMTSQVLNELRTNATAPADPTAYICWYCARPFIGRMSFYIHLLQEALAVPASGLLSGCVFGDEDLIICHICDERLSLTNVEEHISSHKQSESQPTPVQAPVDEGYSKDSKSCPCVGCTQVFADWTALGDHIVIAHTPNSKRAMVKHSCTGCKQVFSSYYHARDHWDSQTTKCCSKSRPDAVEPFTGHTLPPCYWTEDVLCAHDVTFTKYKKYTFCSTYQSSVHVMCFICHKLFYRDADDLEMGGLSQTITLLQEDLSGHMAGCHQVLLSTGVEVNEHGESGANSASDVEDNKIIASLADSAEPRRSTRVSNDPKETSEPASTNKQIGRFCRIHGRRKAEYTGCSGWVCKKCLNLRIWAISTKRTSEYSYTLDSAGSYCSTHHGSLIAIHDSTPYLSYCVDCSESDYGSFRKPCRSFCEDHGPWIEQTNCQKCNKPCKLFTEKVDGSESSDGNMDVDESQSTEVTDIGIDSRAADVGVDSKATGVGVDSKATGVGVDSKATGVGVDSATGVGVDSQAADVGVNSKATDVGVDSKASDVEVDSKATDVGVNSQATDVGVSQTIGVAISQATDVKVDSQATDVGVSKATDVVDTLTETFTITDMAEAEDNVAITYVSELSPLNADRLYKKQRKATPTNQHKIQVGGDGSESCTDSTQLLKTDISSTEVPRKDCANLTKQKCNLHSESLVFSCPLLGTDRLRTSVCRQCRMLQITRSTDGVGKFLKATSTVFCAHHPKSPIVELQNPHDLYCLWCGRVRLKSDLFCRIHPSSDLQLTRKMQHVQGCNTCIKSHELLASPHLSCLPSKLDCCPIHPESSITLDRLTRKYLYCNSCAAKGNEIRHSCSTHGAIDSSSWKIQGTKHIISCPICSKFLVVSLEPLALLLVKGEDQGAEVSGSLTSNVTSDDLALCYALFNGADQAKLKPVETRSAGVTSCKYVKDSEAIVVVPTQVPSRKPDAEVKQNTNSSGNLMIKKKIRELKDQVKICEVCKKGWISASEYEAHLSEHRSVTLPDIRLSKTNSSDGTLESVLTKNKSKSTDESRLSKPSSVSSSTTSISADKTSLTGNSSSLSKPPVDARLTAEVAKSDAPSADENNQTVDMTTTSATKLPPAGHMYFCSKCNFAHSVKRYLDRHSYLHTIKSAQKCSECSFLGAYQSSVKDHLESGLCGTFERKCAPPNTNQDFDGSEKDEVDKLPSETNTEKSCKPAGTSRACSLCRYVAPDEAAIADHKRAHNNTRSMRCMRCHYLAGNTTTLRQHLTSCSVPLPASNAFQQSPVAKQANSSGGLIVVKTCRWKSRHLYCCHICAQVITSYSSFTSHIRKRHRNTHSKKIYPCAHCCYVAGKISQLNQHRRAHKKMSAIKCGSCHFMTSKPSIMKAHKQWCKAWKSGKTAEFTDDVLDLIAVGAEGNAVSGQNDKIAAGECAGQQNNNKTQAPVRFQKKNLGHFPTTLRNRWALKSASTFRGGANDQTRNAVWQGHQFICLHCDVCHSSYGDYSKHMQQKHPNKRTFLLMPCGQCLHVAKDPHAYKVHTRMHTLPTCYRCSHCYYINNQRRHFITHILQCKAAIAAEGLTSLKSQYGSGSPSCLKEVKVTNSSYSPQKKVVVSDDRQHADAPHKLESPQKNVGAQIILGPGSAAVWKDHRLKCSKCRDDITGLEDFSCHVNDKHQSSSPPLLFLCKQCPYVAERAPLFKDHLALHDSPDAIKCTNEECHKLCFNDADLKSHLSSCPFSENQTNWTGHQMICNHCRYSFKSRSDYVQHMKTEHPEARRPKVCLCEQCPYACDPSNFKNHIGLHSLPTAVKCPYCFYLGKSQAYLLTHLSKCRFKLVYEGEPISVEPVTDEKIVSAVAWNGHQLKCTVPQCLYDVTSTEDYTKHMLDMHPDAPVSSLWLCHICPFVALNKVHCLKHTGLHETEGAVKCPFCPFLAIKTKALKSHILRHCQYADIVGEGDNFSDQELTLSGNFDDLLWGDHVFFCPACKERITSHFSYWLHCRRKHPDRQAELLDLCTKCPYVSTKRNEFEMHMLLHLKESSVACQRCSLLLVSQEKLKNHMKRCEGGRSKNPGFSKKKSEIKKELEWKNHKFACKHCGVAVNGRQEYKAHMQGKHAHEKVEELCPCSHCPHVAHGIAESRRHTYRHKHKDQYLCHFCFYLAKSADLLKLHYKKCMLARLGVSDSSVEAVAKPAASVAMETLPETSSAPGPTEATTSADVSGVTSDAEKQCESGSSKIPAIAQKAAEDIARKLKENSVKLKKLYADGQLGLKVKANDSVVIPATSVSYDATSSNQQCTSSESRQLSIDKEPTRPLCTQCHYSPPADGSACHRCASMSQREPLSDPSLEEFNFQPPNPGIVGGDDYNSLQELEELLDITKKETSPNPAIDVIDITADDIDSALSQVDQGLLDTSISETSASSFSACPSASVSSITSPPANLHASTTGIECTSNQPACVLDTSMSAGKMSLTGQVSHLEQVSTAVVQTTCDSTSADDVSRPSTAAAQTTHNSTSADDVSLPSTAAAQTTHNSASADDVSLPSTAAAQTTHNSKSADDVSLPSTAAVETTRNSTSADELSVPNTAAVQTTCYSTSADELSLPSTAADSCKGSAPGDCGQQVLTGSEKCSKAAVSDGTKAMTGGSRQAATAEDASSTANQDDDDVELVVKKTTICYSKRRRFPTKPRIILPKSEPGKESLPPTNKSHFPKVLSEFKCVDDSTFVVYLPPSSCPEQSEGLAPEVPRSIFLCKQSSDRKSSAAILSLTVDDKLVSDKSLSAGPSLLTVDDKLVSDKKWAAAIPLLTVDDKLVSKSVTSKRSTKKVKKTLAPEDVNKTNAPSKKTKGAVPAANSSNVKPKRRLAKDKRFISNSLKAANSSNVASVTPTSRVRTTRSMTALNNTPVAKATDKKPQNNNPIKKKETITVDKTCDSPKSTSDSNSLVRRKSARKKTNVIRQNDDAIVASQTQKRKRSEESMISPEAEDKECSEVRPLRSSKRLRSLSGGHQISSKNGAGKEIASDAETTPDQPIVADEAKCMDPPFPANTATSVDSPHTDTKFPISSLTADPTKSLDPSLAANPSKSLDAPLAVVTPPLNPPLAAVTPSLNPPLIADKTELIHPALSAQSTKPLVTPVAANAKASDKRIVDRPQSPEKAETITRLVAAGNTRPIDPRLASNNTGPTDALCTGGNAKNVDPSVPADQGLSPTDGKQRQSMPTPERAKRRIKLDEYLKRGPRSSDEHVQRRSSTESESVGVSAPHDSLSSIQPSACHGMDTNQHTSSAAAKDFVEPVRKRALTFKQPPSGLDTPTSKSVGESSVTPDSFDKMKLTCESCKTVLSGIHDVVSHTDFHSSTRCYCCHRRFDDLQYLHSHIALAHLGMQQADFQRWKYIDGKKNEMLLSKTNEVAFTAAADPAFSRNSKRKMLTSKVAEMSKKHKSIAPKPKDLQATVSVDATPVMLSLSYPRALAAEQPVAQAPHKSLPAEQPVAQPPHKSLPAEQPVAQPPHKSLPAEQPVAQPPHKSLPAEQPVAQPPHKSLPAEQPVAQPPHKSLPAEQPVAQPPHKSLALTIAIHQQPKDHGTPQTQKGDSNSGQPLLSPTSTSPLMYQNPASFTKEPSVQHQVLSPNTASNPNQPLVESALSGEYHQSPSEHGPLTTAQQTSANAEYGLKQTQLLASGNQIAFSKEPTAYQPVVCAAAQGERQIMEAAPTANSVMDEYRQLSTSYPTIELSQTTLTRQHCQPLSPPPPPPIGVPPVHQSVVVPSLAVPQVALESALKPVQGVPDSRISVNEHSSMGATETLAAQYYVSHRPIPSYRTSKSVSSTDTASAECDESHSRPKREHKHIQSPCKDIDLRRSRGTERNLRYGEDHRSRDIDLRMPQAERVVQLEHRYIPDSPSRDLDLRKRYSPARTKNISHRQPSHEPLDLHCHQKSRSRDSDVRERHETHRNAMTESRSHSREDRADRRGYAGPDVDLSRIRDSGAYKAEYATAQSYNRSSSERRLSYASHDQRNHDQLSLRKCSSRDRRSPEETRSRFDHVSVRQESRSHDRNYERRDRNQTERVADRRRLSAREDGQMSYSRGQPDHHSSYTTSPRLDRRNRSSAEMKSHGFRSDHADGRDHGRRTRAGRQDYREKSRSDVQDHRERSRSSVQDHRESSRSDVQDHRESSRSDVQDHRESSRSDVQDHRESSRSDVQDHSERSRADVQDHRERSRSSVQDHRERSRADVQDHRERSRANKQDHDGNSGGHSKHESEHKKRSDDKDSNHKTHEAAEPSRSSRHAHSTSGPENMTQSRRRRQGADEGK